jgi:hypothetical protein
MVCLSISASSQAQDGKWVGFEVMGNRKVSKAEIVSQIPIKMGDTYKLDFSAWQKWCKDLKNNFNFHFTECSAVRFINRHRNIAIILSKF